MQGKNLKKTIKKKKKLLEKYFKKTLKKKKKWKKNREKRNEEYVTRGEEIISSFFFFFLSRKTGRKDGRERRRSLAIRWERERERSPGQTRATLEWLSECQGCTVEMAVFIKGR